MAIPAAFTLKAASPSRQRICFAGAVLPTVAVRTCSNRDRLPAKSMERWYSETLRIGVGASGLEFCPRLRFSPLPEIVSVLTAWILSAPPRAVAALLMTAFSGGVDVQPANRKIAATNQFLIRTVFSFLGSAVATLYEQRQCCSPTVVKPFIDAYACN